MTTVFPAIDPTAMPVAWAPLIVRPIAQGPERFVAAIAARSQSGEAGCYPLMDGRRMRALFPESANTVGAIVDASMASLRRHVSSQVGLDGWSSPFEGVSLGSPSMTYVRRFRDVYGFAARACSAFGDTGQFDGSASQQSGEPGPWEDSVPDLLKRIDPSLANSINAQLALAGTRHTITFTFYGVNLAANFVLLSSRRMAASLREARAHLWNLSLVAEAPDLLIRPERLELLAGVTDEGPRTLGVIEELAFEARCRHVDVIPVDSSEHAAQQIVARAA